MFFCFVSSLPTAAVFKDGSLKSLPTLRKSKFPLLHSAFQALDWSLRPTDWLKWFKLRSQFFPFFHPVVPFWRLLICRHFHLRRVTHAAEWLFCQARTNTPFVWTKERQQTYENWLHNEHNQTVFLTLLLKSFEATQWKMFWLFKKKKEKKKKKLVKSGRTRLPFKKHAQSKANPHQKILQYSSHLNPELGSL